MIAQLRPQWKSSSVLHVFGHNIFCCLKLIPWVLLFPQKVQKALLQSDVQSKSDKSPVTVADYGLLSSSPVHAFHLLVICCFLFWILIMNHM